MLDALCEFMAWIPLTPSCWRKMAAPARVAGMIFVVVFGILFIGAGWHALWEDDWSIARILSFAALGLGLWAIAVVVIALIRPVRVKAERNNAL